MSQILENRASSPPTWAQKPVSPISESDLNCVQVEAQERAASPVEKHDDWLSFIVDIESWRSDPSQLDDGESVVPTMAVIEAARLIAVRLYRNCRKAPTFVIPSTDGCVVFERHEGNLTEKIVISPEADAEYFALCDSKVFMRDSYPTS